MRRILPFRSIFTAHFSRIAIQGSRRTAMKRRFTVIFHHPWEMVTASVSRRVWVTLTRVSAAPTRSFTRYRASSESPLNWRWSVSPARVADRKDSILFFGGTVSTSNFSRVHALFTRKLHFVRQLSYSVSSSVRLRRGRAVRDLCAFRLVDRESTTRRRKRLSKSWSKVAGNDQTRIMDDSREEKMLIENWYER